jgi:1-acyl-sn-glycerol-3-phosphate acyltransferase
VRRFFSALLYDFVIVVVRYGFYWLTGGIQRYNKKNVPQGVPVIIAPNHTSHLDPPAVAVMCPRRLRFMAKEELFHNRYLGGLIRALRAFPVKRGSGDTEAIRWTLSALEKNEAVLMFPEGTRGDGESLGFVNRGIAMIANRSKAQIVPVAVVGTHKKMPRGGKLRWGFVRVVFGTPFTYDELLVKAGSDKAAREALVSEWERQIIEMTKLYGWELKSAPKSPRPTAPAALEKPSEPNSTTLA